MAILDYFPCKTSREKIQFKKKRPSSWHYWIMLLIIQEHDAYLIITGCIFGMSNDYKLEGIIPYVMHL